MSAMPQHLSGTEILSLEGVSVSYGGKPVLQDLHWQWQWGQSVLVVGPSGAGKSTLAMLAAGLIPRSVEADIKGARRCDPALTMPGTVGYVFQDPDSQFCQIRTGEEVAFGLENLSLEPSLMDPEIREALFKSRLDVPPDQEHMTLSGGNKQKLAIASALAMKPRMLVLDEPTANLDPASTAQVFDQAVDLIGQGMTLLVIEHKFQTLAERVPWMLLLDQGGRLHRFGPTRDLMQEEEAWMHRVGLLEDNSRAQFQAAGVPTRPLLTLTHVNAQYHRRAPDALRDICLRVSAGELVALVGANGAGKSTLLKVMAGLMKPSRGRVEKAAAGGVAFGFQNPEHQFIFEQVADELANRHIVGDVPDDVGALLDEFRIRDHAGASPYALSQGQKRRLSVAVMVQRAHPIYCLDEPTFGQDASTREMIMTRLAERKAQGAAVIISTHDLGLVRRWADRVVVVEAGHIAFDGPWDDLKVDEGLLKRARLIPAPEINVESPPPPVFGTPAARVQRSLLGRLNPAWKLASIFVAVGLTAFAHRLGQAIPLALIPLVLLAFFSGLPVGALAKRLAPFVVFFAMYTWTLTAYAAVGPDTPVLHFLWYRLSYPGFLKGLVLGFRMLAAVGFGLSFVSTVDLVQLVKSLSHDFRVPPKFSYGTLAGLRFFPQFREEWTKLRLARRVRGRDARWSVTRIVTYALPLLSDAVRLSERIAIAMEARGFVGGPAESAVNRTYYHPSTKGWRDLAFGLILIGATAAALWH